MYSFREVIRLMRGHGGLPLTIRIVKGGRETIGDQRIFILPGHTSGIVRGLVRQITKEKGEFRLVVRRFGAKKQK